MEKWITIIILFSVCVIGFFKILYSKKINEKQKKYINIFLDNLREFSNELIKGNYDDKKYEWLKLNSNKTQVLLGAFGKATYIQPFTNLIFENYQIVNNGINNIRELHYRLDYDIDGLLEAEIRGIENSILASIGVINNICEESIKSLKNPIIWLREGVRLIISTPIILIYWLDFISFSKYERIYHNAIIRIISSVISLIGIISTIISTITGWDSIIHFFQIR